ncbi:MAG: Zn-finger nucleic acid-binding protein [Myxococcota bacterium]|jgi:Zn-finger nucleic acid-binding protein
MLARCSSCRRSIVGDRSACLYCGGAAEAVADDRLLSCPGCSRTMSKVDDTGILIDVCSHCDGRFYDNGELERALTSARAAADPVSSDETLASLRRRTGSQVVVDPTEKRRCPVCHELMTRKNFGRVSGVIIDFCSHGMFLDAGEFEQVSDFVRRGGTALAQRQVAADEARDRMDRGAFGSDDGYRVALELGDSHGW